jgi:hypothetical protein
MKNRHFLKKNSFTILTWVIIAIANIVSAIIHGIEGNTASVVFNVIIAVFCVGMAFYFSNNPKTVKR